MNDEISMPESQQDSEARFWAMLCHLAALLGYLTVFNFGFVIPLGNVIGPLIIWAIKKDEIPFVDIQGKEAINFQLTMTIAFAISIVLMFVLVGFFMIILFSIYNFIMIIIAAIKSNDGVNYRYPLTIRFLK